jgi:hypothetical protein
MSNSGYFFNVFRLKVFNLKVFTILLLTYIPFPEVSAQRLSREEAMEELYQQHVTILNLDLLTTESNDQSRYLEELWETYAYYLRYPLAVNSASLPELLQLPVIEQIPSGEEIMKALVVFRTKQPIEDLYDLLDVPGVGPATYEKLWPFFSLEQGIARLRYWYLRPAFWTQDLGLRYLSSYAQVFSPPTSPLNAPAAHPAINPATKQTLLGPRYAQKNRLQLQSAHISAHFAIDKDAGELAPKLGSAPNTSHFALHQLPLNPSKKLMLQTLVFGHLSLNTGLGMVMPSSAFNQTRIRTTGIQSLTRLRPRQGFSEESGLSGWATHLKWQDSASHFQLLLLGSHRSSSMLFSLRYTPRKQSPARQPLHLRLRSYTLTENQSLLHREYPIFGSAWGLFAATRAQKGWDLSVQYELSSRVHTFASLATSQEPIASGYDRYPEQRMELRLGLEYQLPQLPLTLKSSWQYKPQQKKSRGNLQAEFQASEQLRIRSRFLVASATTTATTTATIAATTTPATISNPITTTSPTPQKNHAYLLYHEIRLQPKPWLQLDARYTQFDSPSHETRLYAYENDLRYQFSVSQWQGQGHQYYVLLNMRPFTKKLHIQLKYSQAEYPGQSAIGSGPTQVLGPTKREIKAQILLRW